MTKEVRDIAELDLYLQSLVLMEPGATMVATSAHLGWQLEFELTGDGLYCEARLRDDAIDPFKEATVSGSPWALDEGLTSPGARPRLVANPSHSGRALGAPLRKALGSEYEVDFEICGLPDRARRRSFAQEGLERLADSGIPILARIARGELRKLHEQE